MKKSILSGLIAVLCLSASCGSDNENPFGKAKWTGTSEKVLYSDFLPQFIISADMSFEDETSRASLLFGGNDPRLMDADLNIMGVANGKDEEFDFAAAYCPADFGGLRYCDARVWSFFNMFNKSVGDAYLPYIEGKSKEPMPLYIKPDNKVSVRDIQWAMRDHYEGTALDITNDVGATAYKMPYRLSPLTFEVNGQKYFNERPISTQQSAFTFVAQMRSGMPNEVGGVLWFGTDDANMMVFTPVYCCTTRTPNCYSGEIADCVTFSWESAFWIYNWVADMVRPRYSLMIDDMRAVQNKLEDTYADAQAGIESAALAMHGNDPKKAVEFLTNYTCMTAQAAVDRWKKLGEYLILKYNDGVVKRVNDNGSFKRTEHGKAVLVRPGYPKEFLEELVKATGDRYKVY